tara:strand:+ start:1246 stop:1506 length:261 start_codon:yes stop_codon:yes gene_type:complete
MTIIFLILLFIGPFGCASTDKNIDAIRQQENLIKNHPTWKNHDFEFEKRKPEVDHDAIIKSILVGDSIKSISDTIGIFQIKNLKND